MTDFSTMQNDQIHSALTLILEAREGLSSLKAELDSNLDDDATGKYIQAIDAAQEDLRELIASLESYSPSSVD
jgi:predicted component of type VI protein secretion system